MTGVDDLTRDDLRRANRAMAEYDRKGRQNGVFGEVAACELYGWLHTPDEEPWYDGRHPSRGTKGQIKTAMARIDGEDEDRHVPVDGRIRVWRSQLRSLLSAAGADGQTAWVVFVLLSEDREPLEVKRVRPSTVWSWVTDEMNGWDESGHSNPDLNKQQKLPLGLVFDSVER